MADDLICRVCRAQGSPDNPLYHPCKCSGSMKYVHQECLEEWLSHSRKKHCEICNFKYNFTPIYNPNTPQSISINFFTSIILRKALRALKFYVRVVFAIFVWLILLPYLSVCMFRFWFEPTLLLFDGGSGSNPASGTFGNQTLTAIISNTSTSSPIVNLTSTETPYRIQQRTSLFTPALNFTIEYLQFVASIVGVNDTIWNSFDGAFPLALVHVAGNETGSTSHYSGSSAASSAAEFKKDFGEWIPIIKKFCADVFEGQILLSILIIVAIALLCIKEYIVLNTPVDGAGNPINVPDGVDAAEFLAGGPNALGGGGGGGQAPPAAPAPARRVRRGVRPAAAAVAPQRQPLGPELDAGAAARPADRQRHHNHGHPTASQINTTRSLQNLQNAHQKTFQHALENQTLDSEQVVSLFRTTFNAQQDEAHRHLVANAAHLAVEAAKVKDEEMRGVIGIYREEAVERVKEALSDSGLSLEARSVVLEAFEQSVSGVENLGGGKGLDEIQALVESVEKDLKGTKLRRRSISEEVNSENLAVAETEKVEKITGRLTRSRARAIEMEREKKEKEASFFEEVSEHQPPGKALNTMRSVEEDLEVIRELGMYMSSRGGHQRPVVHRPVIPIRGMVPLGGSSSGAPGGSSSSSAAPTSSGSSSNNSNRPAEVEHNEEFEALIKEFEESYSGKGKKRMSEAEPKSPVESIASSETRPPSHGYSLRSRKTSPEFQQPLAERTQPLPEQPTAPRMSTFDFEAPLAGTTFGGTAANAPLVDPLGEEQLFQDWLRFKEDEEEVIAAAENDAEEDRDQFIRRKRSRTLEHDEGEARNREPEQFEAEDELDRIREERELRNEQALQNILRREELRLQEVERRRLAAQPQLQAQQIDLRAQNVNNNNNNNAGNNNDGFNLNVNLELGPDGIAAEVQAQGDMNAFMELVGIQGPIDMLLQNFALALFIVFAALGAGGWVPYMVGRLMLWLFFDVYYGVVKDGIDFGVKLLETLTDPVLDPIVDGLVVLVKWSGLVTVSNATVAAVAANFTATVNSTEVVWENANGTVPEAVPEGAQDGEPAVLKDFVDKIDKVSNVEPTTPFKSVVVSIGVTGNISENGTMIEQHHEEKGQRFEYVSDLVAAVIAGYFTITFVLYHHARRSGHLRHPYAQTLKRMFYRGFRFLFLAIKFSFFITIELGMFPTFCGLLIDLCTLSCFGPDTTISTRLVFYNAYPWTSYFLHWLAGTTFMFQFAGYVQSVRKVVRPGVVWFIRDPEDPQFHPMQDILEKPVLTQLRKLSFGAMMYAVVVISTIGGYVGMVHVVQHLIGTKRDGGAAMFWPVKWEFSEPLSEFPIDLLIFHFVAPAVMSWIKPKELIVSVLKMYFRFAARRLRLTNFLFGERKVDEENGEVGDDPLVVKLFDEQGDGDVAGDAGGDALPDLAPELENPAEIEDTTANQGVEATLLVPPAILPQQSHRATPYLRVPNHDRIPLKPGTKVMIPMARDAPLVGRVDENEDDIKANWIRVYVPSNLRLRLLGLVFFQWLFGVSLAVFLTMGPLYVGRLFFVALHNYFTNQPLAPLVLPSTNGTSPNLPDISINVTSSQLLRRFRLLSTGNSTSLGTSSTIGRPDLPVHDLFSLSFGLLVFVGVTIALIWLYKCTLAVREHYRRALLDDTNPGSTGEKLWKAAVEGANWAYDNTLMHIVTSSKALFIAFWVGIAVPVLLGLLFEIYVVIPFVGDKAQTRVFFILQDWALGAIYTKVIHSIIMNAPDTELRRVLVQARDQIRQGGLHRLELRPVALKVILPVVLISVGLIFLPPFVFLFMAYLDGDGVSEPGAEMNDLLSRLLVPGLMALFLLYEFVRTTRRSVKRWMDQVRDEHYLVGRRLRNLGEPVAVPPVVQAAETQMAGGAAVGAEIAVDGENIPLLANGDDDDDWVDQDGVQI